jgi:hypothetical protein
MSLDGDASQHEHGTRMEALTRHPDRVWADYRP